MEYQRLITDWVNLYSDGLYSWAYHKTNNKETAEDLVQDTFLAAYNSIDKLKNVSQAKTWLFSILNNKIIDYYRKKGKQKVFTQSETNSESQTNNLFDGNGNWKNTEVDWHWENDNLLDDIDFNVILKTCIGSLPKRWEVAITSKYSLDKSPKEICKELGISSSNYWQIVHRAKLQLKICVEKNWNN